MQHKDLPEGYWYVLDVIASLKSAILNTSYRMCSIGHNYRGYLMPTSVHTVITDSKTCVVGYTSGSLAQYDFHGEQLLQLLRPTDVESYARDSRDFQINQVPIGALVKFLDLSCLIVIMLVDHYASDHAAGNCCSP